MAGERPDRRRAGASPTMHPAEAALFLLLGTTIYPAWLTHIVDCAGDRLWGLLVAVAIVFPIGIVHGVGVWVGAW